LRLIATQLQHNNSAWKYLILSSVGMHMPNPTTSFVSAILIGSLASITLIVATNGAARAADSCLPGPKGAAPKGSHWYYRVDHATKRNCWYVRAEGEKPVAARHSSPTKASPQAETPLQPSIANARAEASPAELGQSNGVAAMPAPAVDPSADNPQSTVASRWLDRQGADSRTPSAPGPADTSASSSAPVAEVPLAAASVPPAPHTSVQTLLLAIVGAIALAGLMAGVIFRFGSTGRLDRDARDTRRTPWDAIDVRPAMPPPLAASAPAPRAEVARERREAIIPNEIVQLLSKLSKEAAA
jgi:hypothetical protein